MKYIINSFKAYISNYGEDKLTVYLVDVEDHLKNIPDHPCFKKIIISDRSFISSLAYQEPADWIGVLNKYAKKPDLLLLLDLCKM